MKLASPKCRLDDRPLPPPMPLHINYKYSNWVSETSFMTFDCYFAAVARKYLDGSMQTPPGNGTMNPRTMVPPLSTRSVTVVVTSVVLGSVIILLTVCGQIIVFYVVYKDRRLREPSHYFMSCLATADLLIGLVLMPVWTLYTAMGYWPLGPVWCALWNAADYSFCTMSINTICLIATDRYLCLKYPFSYPIKRTSTAMKVVLSVICVGSCVVQSTIILLTQYYYNDGMDTNICITNFVYSLRITVWIITCTLWIPMIVTVIMYGLIFRIASNVSSKSLDIETHNDSPRRNGHTQTVRKHYRKDLGHLRAVKTIGCLLGAFMVCWMPFSVAIIYHSIHLEDSNPWILIITYWICYLNSVINPICYALGNSQFRETLMKKVLKVVGMSHASSSGINLQIR